MLWRGIGTSYSLTPSSNDDNYAATLARILLYGYAFLVPIEALLSLDSILGVGGSSSLTKAYGIIIAALIVILRPHFIIAWTWPAYMLAAWLMWGTLSSYMNSVRILNSVLLNIGFALTIPACLSSRRHVEHVCLAMALGGGLAAWITALNPTYTVGDSRLIGLGTLNANTFIIICDIALLCSLYFIVGLSSIRIDSTVHLLLIVCVPVLIWCIAATGSRTGWAALGGALFLSAWVFAPPSPRRWIYRFLTLGAGLIVAAMIFTNAMLAERVRSGLDGETAGRDKIWKMAWTLFQEHADPVWGMGMRQADRFLPRYASPDARWYGWDRLDVHSTYLTVLIETGFVGLLLFLLALLAPVLFIAVRYRHTNLGLLTTATMTILLIASLTGTWYADKILWLVWGCSSVVVSILAHAPDIDHRRGMMMRNSR